MTVGLLAGLILATAIISRRLVDGPITPPALFAVAGTLAAGVGLVSLDPDAEAVVVLTEATLTVILFVDAARIPLRSVRGFAGIPLRLLGLGLPLAILFGTLVGITLLGLEWPQALLLGSALGATDAALGKVVISSPDVPPRMSQSINVESGLNDGLAVPVLTFAAGVVATEVGMVGDLPIELVRQIGLAAVAGPAVGFGAGRLIRWAQRRDLLDGIFGQLATASTAALAYLASDSIGGNGFIAAYLAGAAFGWVCMREAEHLSEFSEDAGSLLNLVAFFVFGAVLVEPALGRLDWRVVTAGVAFLTVVRMLAVELSLLGTRLGFPSRLYLGWFGPRGLASILFAFLLIEDLGSEVATPVISTIVVTVMLSVFAHGVTARPLSGRYAAWYRTHAVEEAPEGDMEMPPEAPRMRT